MTFTVTERDFVGQYDIQYLCLLSQTKRFLTKLEKLGCVKNREICEIIKIYKERYLGFNLY